jgi:Flp pilus assembly pilin Flp
MRNKLKMLPIVILTALKNFAEDLKKDERGLEVVQVVLIVLVGVLLVALLWGVLSGWLQELWTNITGAANEITTNGAWGGAAGGGTP